MQLLCEGCRGLPQHRLLTTRQLADYGLTSDAVRDMVAGRGPNPVDPRFPGVRLYFWADVVERCRLLGLPTPRGAPASSTPPLPHP